MEFDKEELATVVRSALEYLLEYGENEGIVALGAQLLTLQVQVMQAVKEKAERKRCAEEQKRYAQQRAPAGQTSEEMLRMLQLSRAQMMQNVAPLWNTQEEGEKSGER